MATPEVLEKLTRTQEELAELDRRLGSVEDAIGALILPRPPLYYSPSTRQKKKIKCKVCGYEYTTPPNFCPKCLTPPENPKKSSSPQRYWVVIYRTPIELRWRREYYPTREEARTRKELLTRFDYEARYFPAGFSSPEPSRWVLEMYPLDVLAWRRSLIELTRKPLTSSEYRLVSSYDDYLRRKGYLTSRQIEVLGEIGRRHDVELPAIPEVVVR